MQDDSQITITAAMLVIGDELLSGRTKDKNIGFVAEYLTALGIELAEVRIVPDEEDRIIAAVNALRRRYAYVFTSGGIGPTHDDITAEAISKAFDLPCEINQEALALMTSHYQGRRMEFTEARKRMARTPRGATLIDNPISIAPGFRIENVHVMAGVPVIMQKMMDAIAPTLKTGTKILSQAVDCPFGEGTIGGPLGEIQTRHPNTMIGSYPRFQNGKYSTQIVIRSKHQSAIDDAKKEVETMLEQRIADKKPLL